MLQVLLLDETCFQTVSEGLKEQKIRFIKTACDEVQSLFENKISLWNINKLKCFPNEMVDVNENHRTDETKKEKCNTE